MRLIETLQYCRTCRRQYAASSASGPLSGLRIYRSQGIMSCLLDARMVPPVTWKNLHKNSRKRLTFEIVLNFSVWPGLIRLM